VGESATTAVAVTGHMDLTAATTELVREALRKALADQAEHTARLVGISCLAPGADTLFAEAVLAAGGDLVAVLPAADYRRVLAGSGRGRFAVARFDRLLSLAAEVVVMPFDSATEAAYEAANAELLKRAELLVAVWDGVRNGRGGGTAHMVAAALEAGLPVQIVWPATAARVG
jgi:hypothetical protein